MAAVAGPKDVIIILDISNPESTKAIAIVKAAKSIIKNLTWMDHVGIVFSVRGATGNKIMRSRPYLLNADEVGRKNLNDFLDKLTFKELDLTKGFDETFKLFDVCDRVLSMIVTLISSLGVRDA